MKFDLIRFDTAVDEKEIAVCTEERDVLFMDSTFLFLILYVRDYQMNSIV